MKRKIQINSSQTTYVKKRIEEINKQKEASIRQKYLWVKPTISLEEKIKLIQNGKFEIRPHSNATTNLDWALIFTSTEDPYVKERAEALNRLNAERTQLMDNLILGDVAEALSMLESFSKKEY